MGIETQTAKQPIWNKSFISIFLSNFFIFLIFYSLLTTLPIYVVEDLQRSKMDAGLVVTAFLLSAIFFRPFSGKLIADYGKKKILLIVLSFFLLSTFLYLWIDSFYGLLALRFFHGIWFSIATTATGAIAADVIPQKRRGEGLGYFAMSMNIAVVAGPFIGLTILNYMSFQAMFMVLSALMLVGFVFTFFIHVKESNNTTPDPVQHKKLSFDDLFERKAIPIAFIGCLIAFTYSGIISFLSIYAQSLGLLQAASYFFVVFAIAMLISRPFVGRLFDTRGPSFVLYPSFIFYALGLATLSVTDSAFMLLLSGVLIGFGYGSLIPCFQTLAVQSTVNKRNGHATATFFTFMDTGIASGSFVLGIIASTYGYANLYFASAIFVLLTILVFRWILQKRRQKPSDHYILKSENI